MAFETGTGGEYDPSIGLYDLSDYSAARVFGGFALLYDRANLASYEQGQELSERATSLFIVRNDRELGDPANQPMQMRRENGPDLTIWADLKAVAIHGIAQRTRPAKPKAKPFGFWTSVDSQIFPFVGNRLPRTARTRWHGIMGAKRDQIAGAKRSTIEELEKSTKAFDEAVDFALEASGMLRPSN